MPWNKLVIGGIYILLYLRNDPPLPNDFHWAMYMHTAQKAGFKYHIKTLGSGWIPDHSPLGSVFNEFLLIGLLQIGRIELADVAKLDGLARTWDAELNSHDFTCRRWLLRVFGLMMDNGVLDYGDVDELELEAKTFGNEHASDAAKGRQPLPVVISKLHGEL